MVKDELMGMVREATGEFLRKSQNAFMENILNGCTENDSEQEIYAKMFQNAINISVQASVQAVFSLMCDSNIISEQQLKEADFKPLIKVVKDDE